MNMSENLAGSTPQERGKGTRGPAGIHDSAARSVGGSLRSIFTFTSSFLLFSYIYVYRAIQRTNINIPIQFS